VDRLFSLPDIWESVTIAINRDCNIFCDFCPVKTDKKTLSPDKVREVTQLFSQLNPRWTVRAKIQGGEPLLHWGLLRLIIAECHQPNIQLVITTNGLLLDKEKISFLSRFRKRIELVISIDGQKWDLRRHSPLLRKTRVLKQAGLRGYCAFNITITPDFQPETIELFKILKYDGWTDFRFYPAFYTAWTDKELMQLRRTFSEIASLTDSAQFAKLHYAFDKKWLRLYFSRLSQLTRIPLVCDNLFVDNSGEIFVSAAFLLKYFQRWKQKDFSLCNVYNPGWQQKLLSYKSNPDMLFEKITKLDEIYKKSVDKKVRNINCRLLQEYTCFSETIADSVYRKAQKSRHSRVSSFA